MICGNTSDFIDHPLPKLFVYSHGAFHHLNLALNRPWEEIRLAQPTLSLGIGEAVKMIFPHLAIISRPPVPAQLPKPKRCNICPWTRDRQKTKQIWSKCCQPVCKDHATLMCICTDCHPAGKTSCKLLFTAWHLCSFINVTCKQSCLVS